MSESFDGRGDAMPLSQLLRSVARDLHHLQPPPELRARVLASARLAGPVPPRRRRRPWALAAGGAATGLAVLAVLLLAGRGEPGSDDRAGSASSFMPLASATRWQQLLNDSATPAWLVTTELPRDRLAALGLPFDPARAAEPVRAELLMHASGEVIAVRVIGQ